ncbi:hypothetical protein BX600DRAFT_538730 [Xylariales sp. PMI_506]|nr:hypothetical protein BX600DRAFT_538730 [Xylariales sp. PMI_506]
MPKSPVATKRSAAIAAIMDEAPAREVRMSYRIGRGEQGVLTFEPYKSALLPLWRFRTAPLARRSAADLWACFEGFGDRRDFVGMDMSRKFIQMGMTRAKRYANHPGGRKYDRTTGEELPRRNDHPGKREKEEASRVFRGYWERCRAHDGYKRLKEEFQAEQKAWQKSEAAAATAAENAED